MIQFLQMILDSLDDILSFDFVTGISISTILFYNLLLITIFTAYVHKR